jgi:hypothetical protein
LDYKDFQQPLHKKNRLIEKVKIVKDFQLSNFTKTKNTHLDAQINSIELNDNPYESPWASESGDSLLYLTTGKHKASEEEIFKDGSWKLINVFWT